VSSVESEQAVFWPTAFRRAPVLLVRMPDAEKSGQGTVQTNNPDNWHIACHTQLTQGEFYDKN